MNKTRFRQSEVTNWRSRKKQKRNNEATGIVPAVSVNTLKNPSMNTRLKTMFEVLVRPSLWVCVLILLAAGCSKVEQTSAPKPSDTSAANAAKPVENDRTALDEYVAAPDPNYSYRLVSSVPGTGHTTHILEMTSQAWLTTNEVDRPLWKHWMTIVKPDQVTSSKSLLFIGGGGNGGSPPQGSRPQFGQDRPRHKISHH
jgi:PhoPQ-activated pathogenicity-related protein